MKKTTMLLVVLIVLIALLSAALIYALERAKQEELNRIFLSFSCNCCEKSLKESDAYCAVGIKEKIKAVQGEGIRKQELFTYTVKLLGIREILDPVLREEIAKQMRDVPPESRAILKLQEDSVNFGNVSESETAFVMKDFTITNEGKEDLYIYGVETSCSCLSSKFILDPKESPVMGRFSFPYGMTIKIKPKESARIRVTYDARVNSYFRGHEVRWIYIYSNDVVNPTSTIKIEAIHSD
jgi:hypothetical protein